MTGPDCYERTCTICPSGTYSDIATARNCTMCPAGGTTVGEGSTNAFQCRHGTITLIQLTSTSEMLRTAANK